MDAVVGAARLTKKVDAPTDLARALTEASKDCIMKYYKPCSQLLPLWLLG